ncbi:MAG TPA: sucrase ferredoxin [Gaiellaceae bacterium]|nr:sucrase ferredoxin [Gaiellaceae bacterium]
MTGGRCAEISEAAGEPLGATATTARSWLLIESVGTWPRDVSDAPTLDEPDRAAVRAWLESTPTGRLLYIRRPGRRRGSRAVFVVRAAERQTEVRRLDAHASLAEVDLARDGEVVDAQLVLVCGHGSRDACCALRGTAVYGALESRLGEDELWLSSHQGGHRFAANVLLLPQGIQLGRVAPTRAGTLLDAALAGTIDLTHYRGRTAYTQREQAGERLVREANGILELADLRLIGDDGEFVRFVDVSGVEHRVVVDECDGPTLPASCGVPPAPQKVLTARAA